MIDLENARLRRLDAFNWCVERQQKSGKWINLGYYPKLEQAANRLLADCIGDADTLRELISSVEQARDEVKAICEKIVVAK